MDPKDDAKIEEVSNSDEGEAYVPGTDEEKKLLRKIDLRLLPTIWVMYIFNYLDRNNIGNASIAGMNTDLGLSSSDYAWALSIFFFGYVLFEVPSNMILSRSRPSVFIPAIMIVWGCLCCVMACIQNLGGLMALRFILGCIEAGFAPGVLFLMSSWYKKEEQAKRFAVYWSAAVSSGAFGGLLAGSIISGLDKKGGLAGWRWLFIIEGIATVIVAITAHFFLADFPESAKGFTEAERRLAILRLKHDGQRDMNTGGNVKVSHTKAFLAAVRDWRIWGLVLLYSMIVGAGTISYFIPNITKQLGYNTVTAQYMTVPVYMVAVVFCLCGALSSDHFGDRRYHITAFSTLAIVSCIVAAVVHTPTVRYVMLCFIASGIYTALPMVLTWTSGTIHFPREKRAISIAIVNALGNLSSIYGSRIWPDWDGPYYPIGFGVTGGFLGVGAILALVLGFLFLKFPYEKSKHSGLNLVQSETEEA